MPEDVDRFLSYVENDWEGSRRDFLDVAREYLTYGVCQTFEEDLERGYKLQCDVNNSDFFDSSSESDVYAEWCWVFKLPCTTLFRNGMVYIHCSWLSMGKLSQDQIDELKRLGWRGEFEKDNFVVSIEQRPENYTRSVEETVQEALDILNLPFHRGLPPPNPLLPIRTRYERLMGEDDSPVYIDWYE